MEEFQKQFGLYLKQMRRERNLSQEGLAAATGLTKQYISTVERGLSRPGIDTLYKFANGFGVTVSDLFRFEYEAGNLQELKQRVVEAVNATEDSATPETLYTKILNVFIRGQK